MYILLSKAVYNTCKSSFKDAKSRVQREIRQMKNSWWASISAEMKRAYDAKDSRSVYSTIKKVFSPQPPSVVPLKSKDGSTLIKDI